MIPPGFVPARVAPVGERRTRRQLHVRRGGLRARAQRRGHRRPVVGVTMRRRERRDRRRRIRFRGVARALRVGRGGPGGCFASAEVRHGRVGVLLAARGRIDRDVRRVRARGGFLARSFTTNLVTQIPYAELPSTHRLTALCEDIYAMRHAREFALEERLYWLLIRIYRSPAVLFEFTRTKSGDALPERPNPRAARGAARARHGDGLRRRGGWTAALV